VQVNVSQLARLVNGKVFGNGKTAISGFAGINEARKGDITFIANDKYIGCLKATRASAVVVSAKLKAKTKVTLIRTKNPDFSFVKIAEYFSENRAGFKAGIHRTAIVGNNSRISPSAAVQAYVTIGEGAKIGSRTEIYPNVYIGKNATIGNNCLVYANVSIREGTVIGNNVIIHSGTVIGSDGFGYAQIGKKRYKIPQTGIVVIEDDVEIGANVTIDRARFDKTVIGKGTKIDNLVHIAHNVVIGDDSVLVAQVGISGSARLGKNVTMAGQSATVGHISIGDNVIVAGRSVVTKNIPSGVVVSGFPAQPHKKQLQQEALIRRLPELYKVLKNRK
jgi:UDP-3-O-[3-hydroxymyristoyl] glucosamine N-acyltransferase